MRTYSYIHSVAKLSPAQSSFWGDRYGQWEYGHWPYSQQIQPSRKVWNIYINHMLPKQKWFSSLPNKSSTHLDSWKLDRFTVNAHFIPLHINRNKVINCIESNFSRSVPILYLFIHYSNTFIKGYKM